MIISPAVLSASTFSSPPFQSLLYSACALCDPTPSRLSLHFCLTVPASILTAGLNHPCFCLPCHVWTPCLSVQASSHSVGASWADILLQHYRRLMSVTPPLTCPSLKKHRHHQTEGHVSAAGAVNCQVRFELFSSMSISDQTGKEIRKFDICLYSVLSKPDFSWLQIFFRPFHSNPAVSSLGILRLLSARGSTSALFSSERSWHFPTDSASNGTPPITQAHMLACAHTL